MAESLFRPTAFFHASTLESTETLRKTTEVSSFKDSSRWRCGTTSFTQSLHQLAQNFRYTDLPRKDERAISFPCISGNLKSGAGDWLEEGACSVLENWVLPSHPNTRTAAKARRASVRFFDTARAKLSMKRSLYKARSVFCNSSINFILFSNRLFWNTSFFLIESSISLF